MTEIDDVEVLLVEDSDDDAEMTIDALMESNVGIKLLRLRDGQAALDFIFQKGDYSGRKAGLPKLILLDINMPKVDGIEVLRQLRADEATMDVPVVMLTSSAEEADLHRSYRMHANSYIVKPVGFDQFVAAIREIGLYWLVLNRQNLPGRASGAPA